VHGLKSGSLMKELRGHVNFVSQVQLINEQFLMSAGSDGQVIVWDLQAVDNSKMHKVIKHKEDCLLQSAHAIDPNHLLVCYRERSCQLLELDMQDKAASAWKIIKEYDSNRGKGEELVIAVPSGKYVYSISNNHLLYVFDKESAKLISYL